MLHVSMMRLKFCYERTNEQGDSRSRMDKRWPWCMYTWCMYPWYIYTRSFIIQWCMYVWCIYSWSWYTWPWCTYIWCMMRAFIHDPDTCMYDACIFALRSWTLIHVYMCDAYIYYPWSWHMCVWCMYSWCGIFVMHGQTLTLMHIYMMHVCTMHIHMLLDHYAYVHDALMYDAYIHDPWYLTMLHVCMMRLKFCSGRTNERTNKAILGVGLVYFSLSMDLWKLNDLMTFLWSDI